MSPVIAETAYQPDREYRRSFLLLRWLLFVLGAYLTLFSYLGKPHFDSVFSFVVAFALSNAACMFVGRDLFSRRSIQHTILGADILFVCGTLYFLRLPATYVHVVFSLVFILIALWRDLRVVGVSLLAVSLSYGVFSSLDVLGMLDPRPRPALEGFVLGNGMERFLMLSLFFIVSIFYLFLADQMRKHSRLTVIAIEENRRMEIMGEVARAISSSPHSDQVLQLIAARLGEVFEATDCCIVRLDRKSGAATMLAKSKGPRTGGNEFEASEYPEILQAHDSREVVFLPAVERMGKTESVIASPMLVQDAVVGVIHVRLQTGQLTLSESDERFCRVMSMTGAAALRNTELLEEMAHRARTDFLTNLPNQRFFQFTLSSELERAHRHNHPMSLLIIDLDYLKIVNDRFGHPTGDLVIRTAGEIIRSTCRDFDFAARYGGEEFAVILPETPLTGAIDVAERIRERLAGTALPGIGSVTASIGVANFPVNALGKEDLIRVADKALYMAKGKGRDRVEYFAEQLVSR